MSAASNRSRRAREARRRAMLDGPCPDCGEIHDPTKCQGHRNSDGKQCRRPPITGGWICPTHGGSADQVRNAANRRVTEAKVALQVARHLADYQVDDPDPLAALLETVAIAWAMMRLLADVVGELDAAAGGIFGPNHLGDGAPHVATEMLRHWTAECGKASKLALDAGVEERRVRIAESQGDLLERAVRGILTDFGISLDDPRVPGVVGRHLRAIGEAS